MPLISVKAWSRGVPILFFSIARQCRSLNINICSFAMNPSNSPCLIVSLETSFEEDNQSEKDGSSESQKEESIFYVCVFCRYIKTWVFFHRKFFVQQFEIYAKDIATQMLSTSSKGTQPNIVKRTFCL